MPLPSKLSKSLGSRSLFPFIRSEAFNNGCSAQVSTWYLETLVCLDVCLEIILKKSIFSGADGHFLAYGEREIVCVSV